jgi:signal transduction histidine kinase
VTNLVSNAIKFSPEGGRVTLIVREEDRGGEPWVALEVHDEGVGIPIEDVPRIFERFYRGSNVAGAIEGTGLGLTGSRHIAEQHGGELLVESVQGKGSIFTLLLPAHAPISSRDISPQNPQVVGVGAP